jgi:hypothetical protein
MALGFALFDLDLAAALNANGISIRLLAKLLAVAGLSARTANSSGVPSSSGFVIAVPSNKF